jgi:acyl-coenzyme A thioesterase PaaI-like protein
MNDALSRIERARSTGDWDPLAQSVPFARFLGMTLDVQESRLVGQMKFSEHLIGNPTLPALHGGTLGSLLESQAQFELLFRTQTVVLPKTITLTMDFRRSGKSVDTFVTATVVRQGRRVATVQAVAWQEDAARPIASATVQLLILGAV